MYCTTKFSSAIFITHRNKKTQILVKKTIYLGLSILRRRWKKCCNKIDTSNFELDRLFLKEKNKEAINLMKYELGGRIM